jgi:hypothetical protein
MLSFFAIRRSVPAVSSKIIVLDSDKEFIGLQFPSQQVLLSLFNA